MRWLSIRWRQISEYIESDEMRHCMRIGLGGKGIDTAHRRHRTLCHSPARSSAVPVVQQYPDLEFVIFTAPQTDREMLKGVGASDL